MTPSNSNPKRAPLPRVSTVPTDPKVRVWIAELVKFMFPVAPMVRAPIPAAPKPAWRVPSLTFTPESPPFKVVVPLRLSVPAPVLMRFPPVLVTLVPAAVRIPVELTTLNVPSPAPIAAERFKALVPAPV